MMADWVVLSVGGKRFETTATTLAAIPYFASAAGFKSVAERQRG